MKLRTKFVVLLMPLVMAPLLFVGNLSYTQLRESAEQRFLDEIESSTAFYKQVLETQLATAAANTRMLSDSAAVRTVFDNELPDDARIGPFNRLLTTYQNDDGGSLDLRVLDSNGNRLASSPDLAGIALPDELLEGVATDGSAFRAHLAPHPDRDTASLLFAEPVRTADGRRLGSVVLSLGLRQLEEAFHTDNEKSDSLHFLADRDSGQLFAQAPATLEGLGDHADVSQWITATENDETRETQLWGEEYFVRAAELTDNLLLVAAVPAQQLTISSRRIGGIILLVTLAAVAMTAAALYLGLHQIVLRPLRQLRAAFRDVGRGAESIELDTDSKDEIGDLANAFQAMHKRLQASNDHVEYLAYHDSLTGLPNRTLFRDQLKAALSQARREGQKLAILFVDLDDFKRINDTLGHQVGDEILRRVSETVVNELRDSDLIARISKDASDHVIARLGGDEFVILLRNVADEYAPRTVARRLCKRLREPVVIEGNELYVSASVGISMFPDDSNSADDLIKNADAAMYHAKALGKNHFQYFSRSMNEAAATRLEMETKLRKALELDQFELYFQPKVDPKTYSIVGAEALIRWHDPEVGVVPPDAFIGIAEDTGLIVPIGEWVLNKACIQLKEWQMRGLPPVGIAVNVSAIQVARQDLGFIVARALRNSGVKAKYLDIEITESALMTGSERTIDMLEELRSLDVTVSLDDFGTGYSSLSYLRKFPISNLKIDRSFFSEIESDESSRSIVAAIIAMSKSLKMTVTAEGVENEQQMEFLRRHDCDFAQGYLISPPVQAHEFEALLSDTDGQARGAGG